MVGAREQQVDVLHRAKSRPGVAGGDGRALEDDGLEPGVGERAHGERHRTRDEQQTLHGEGVGGPAEDGPLGTQRIERVGRAEGPPQQGADAVFFGGRDGEAEVGAAVESPPHGGRIGFGAAGLPEQARRRLDRRIFDDRLAPHVLIMPPGWPW